MNAQSCSDIATQPFRTGAKPFELIPHRRTQSAAAEARALGVKPCSVAKTVVLRHGPDLVRAVVPAERRVSLRKLTDVLADRDVHVASEAILAREYPEFELGAVPPVGGARDDPVFVDRHLVDEASIVFEAGTHEQSLRVSPHDLVDVSQAWVVDICQD
jgi:Ala-tRNA(Pro) deacylase